MYDAETLGKYADVMLWGLARGRRAPLRKSDFVLVRFDLPGLPLAEELCGRLHDMDMIPVPRMQPTPRMEHDFYAKANNKRLTTLPPGERDLYSNLGGCITIIAPESLTHLASIEPERIAMARAARRPLQDIAHLREDMGAYGWTLCIWPTAALAGQAGLSLADYADEVRRACLLGEADPAATWARVAKQAEAIRTKLDELGDATLHVEADGTDLRLRVGRMRRWAGVTGRNIPSFELYVSPDWRSVEGVYTADLPSFRSGNIVQGVRLEFRQGRVVRLDAEQGEGFATGQLNSDPGAAMLGEFALVDRRFSRITRFMANTLYDENHGGPHGSMHVALGQSYANTFSGPSDELTADARRDLGFNSSSLHWDLVATTPRKVTAVTPGGARVVIYEDGEFRL
ncbi:aminopeptidase [Nitratidesulfovibrio liaohensis]|uniref:Aminopeptidase n=1 Tax=Nitratidesulfovibrio liaohensis TaxID=2604158 RepID=A0ABY9R058_9BACT|nr:aminopeptidase [Nitratidesulfovibrio liaohensis]WMW65124.1 aminopeptidase [Nitratidesulfovibrio liaohensis]